MHDEGERPTRRQIARLFGWSEHYARQMLERVKTERTEWVESYPKTHMANLPPMGNEIRRLREQNTHKSPTKIRVSPDRAGDSQYNTFKTHRE